MGIFDPSTAWKQDVLTLITCMGFDETSGEYAWRIAVKAVLLSVE
jgi:hypothetical protein